MASRLGCALKNPVKLVPVHGEATHMLGFGPLGANPIGWGGDFVSVAQTNATVVLANLIIPEARVHEGVLIRSTSVVWFQMANAFGKDWSRVCELTPTQWEEMVAGAYRLAGYEVILTPRSGDGGRDVVATSKGVGSIRILGSVKAYSPGHLVDAEACRSLLGVVTADQKASKGIITTTSDFAPRIKTDPSIAPFLPTRLELMNGKELQAWLLELSREDRKAVT